MVRESEIRPSEVAVAPPAATDAGLVFIGRIRTPWTSRLEAPRQGRQGGPLCRLELSEPWVPALSGLDRCERAEVIYWLHLSRRDLVPQSPADEEALSIANDTLYGLGAGVWSRDGNRAYRFGRAVQAGRVWTNCYHLYPAHAAFGGYKASGIGRENHKMMLDHYQQTKNMLVS